jgi:hypothetical protein
VHRKENAMRVTRRFLEKTPLREGGESSVSARGRFARNSYTAVSILSESEPVRDGSSAGSSQGGKTYFFFTFTNACTPSTGTVVQRALFQVINFLMFLYGSHFALDGRRAARWR